jgi:hypothetical protein
MSEKNKRNDRMSESEWIRMGPEEADLKLRNANVPPDGIAKEIWATVPAEVRRLVWNELSLKAKLRRPITPTRTNRCEPPNQKGISP